MAEALWSLIGVFVGFLLSEGTQWLKKRSERQELRTALNAELQSIVRMVPSKLDILLRRSNISRMLASCLRHLHISRHRFMGASF
jgi:hypothetical protein